MYQGKYVAKGTAIAEKPGRKRGIRIGTIIFYCLYLLLFPAFFLLMSGAMDALEVWLTKYEASQPNVKCQQVYSELFDQPDWEKLYVLAGLTDTKFEGKDSFVAYMTAKIDPAKLSYNETSAGLSGDHKYVVKHDGEKIAVFTLTGGAQTETEIPEWKLGTLELFYSAEQAVQIRTHSGVQVFVNDVALDESYIIKTTTTVAEKYLPEGLHGIRTQTFHVTDLLTEPQISAQDADGNPVELVYDAETGIYTQQVSADSYADYEQRILGAAEVYCKYMIRAVNGGQLKNYFDRNSEIHDSIYRNETWMQSYQSYRMEPAVISEFVKYFDDFFSARVAQSMFVTRWDDTVKEYNVDATFFFQLINGKWYAVDMTNVQIQQELTQVRLTYHNGGTVLQSVFVAEDAKQVTPPSVEVPAGKVFTGWFRKTTDEAGKTTYSLVLLPDETGKVTLPEGTALEPMELFAMFENEGEE